MTDGWIKLSRQLQEHWLWKDEPFDKARAWIDLIMLANWEDKKTVYKGQVITCKRGDVNLSFSALAKRWHWNRKKVTRFIEILKSDEMVATNVTTNRTTITIVNYDKYQCYGSTDGASDGSTNVQRMSTTNKDKKDKNIKKYVPPKKKDFSEKQNYNFEEIARILEQ